MSINNINHIIEQGRDITIESNRREIERQVKEKYNNDLKKSGIVGKIIIYFIIKHEIRKKIEEIAPRTGLYLKKCK